MNCQKMLKRIRNATQESETLDWLILPSFILLFLIPYYDQHGMSEWEKRFKKIHIEQWLYMGIC